MRNLFTLVLSLILFFACKNEQNEDKNENLPGSYSVVDDLGDTLTFDSPPQKIITLAPNLTEILFAVGAGDRLIADTKYCNFPEAAKKLPKAGDLLTINYELVASLKPDLILMTIEGNTKDVYDRLKESGNNVFISNPRDYNGIKKTVKDIAAITGNPGIADSLFTEWDGRLEKIKSDTPDPDGLQVMFMVSANPIMLAGKNTFVNEYLKMLGLRNIADEVELNYPIFSRERIFEVDPDYIFYPGMEKNVRENVLNLYPEWNDLTSIKKGNFFTLDPDLFYRPGPRFIDALDTLKTKVFRSR